MISPTIKKNGFTLIEVMVVVALLSFVMAATYNAFLTGQSVWFKTEPLIVLQDNLSTASTKMSSELRLSGHDHNGMFQVWIDDNAGVHGSDMVRFSIPIVCQTNSNPVDAEGNPAHWGAPLTWGCTQSSCMDANESCSTIEYKYVQYILTAQNTLIRRVLDYSQMMVREDLIADHITEMQIEPNFNQRLLILRLTAQHQTMHKQNVTQSLQTRIFLRNAR